MAACKRRRENDCIADAAAPASPAAIECTLSADLLLEIMARSDICTLVRGAGTSWLLRDGILSRRFIDRVTQLGGIVPRCIVASLNTHDDTSDPPPPLSLVHPATADAVSFVDGHMSPFMSRFAGDLLGEHIPLTSRAGFVLFRRRHESKRLPNLCVYDLFTGHRSFFSDLPDIGSDSTRRYQLLTFEDGIGCSFFLFVANLGLNPAGNSGHSIQVQTATSTCGTWAPAAMIHQSNYSLKWAMGQGVFVLHGSVMHWLVRRRGEIVTYNICTMEQGKIMLPAFITNFEGGLFYLGSYYSHDGRKLLRLLAYKEFKIFVWHQLTGGDWTPEDMTIDTEEKLRSLDLGSDDDKFVLAEFKCSSEGSNTVLMRMYIRPPSSQSRRRALLVICDLETKEVRVQEHPTHPFVVLEFDLPSRLRAMELS